MFDCSSIASSKGGETISTAAPAQAIADRSLLQDHFRQVRQATIEICAPLEVEDYVVQSMPDVSPTRWHLAHTTWFFETFLLARADAGFSPLHREFGVLFNSYYNSVGDQFPRAQRGLLTRPTVDEIYRYREHVDHQIDRWLESADDAGLAELLPILILGIHHEQQHQELMLTDIKHVFSCNPLAPAYRRVTSEESTETEQGWVDFQEGVQSVGHTEEGFCYDNELPRHRVFLEQRQLADRLVTNDEYQQFVDDGGYQKPALWLSAGWSFLQEHAITHPIYWRSAAGGWRQFTLGGDLPLEPNEPVCHVSYFEAEAFARWAGARLPTEAEWEIAAVSTDAFDIPAEANVLERGNFHPLPVAEDADCRMRQLVGDVWEWTQSPYVGYPGYKPPPGAIGEYNGKFMCNQFVLRGGSCATSGTHIRPTYRNFFPPEARWQFTGIRLAK